MHWHPPDWAAVEVKEIVQRINTVPKKAPNSRSSKILQQGMENVHNKEVLALTDDKLKTK